MVPQGGRYEITVYQGADYSEAFQLLEPDGVTPTPLNGYSAQAQVRAQPGAADPPLATFTVVVDQTPTPTGTAGTVTLSLTGVQTAALAARASYDVFLVGPATALFLQGPVVVDRRVTVVV